MSNIDVGKLLEGITPGEWVVSPLGKSVTALQVVPGPQGKMRRLSVSIAKQVDPANANLIAAAPDLFEACVAFEAGQSDAALLIRAAIAKARGEQS